MGTTHSKNALSASRDTLDVDWERLDKAFSSLGLEQKIPENSFTVDEYMDRSDVDISYPGALHRLKKLVDNGTLGKTKGKRGRNYYFFKESE